MQSPEGHKIRFVLLHEFQWLWEAELVRSKMESENIKTIIIDENINYTIGPTFVNGYRLMVDREKILEAKRLLDKILHT